MAAEWHALTDLIGDRDFVVTSVRIEPEGITIKGEFEQPPLASLSYEDQVFVGEFVRCHGSIKHMEKAFGVSYPTIKNRLNRISGRLASITVEEMFAGDEVLDQLERGEITADEAVRRLRR